MGCDKFDKGGYIQTYFKLWFVGTKSFQCQHCKSVYVQRNAGIIACPCCGSHDAKEKSASSQTELDITTQ